MSKRKDEIHANYDNFIEKVRAGRASAPALKSMYKFGKAAKAAEESDMKKEIKQVYKVGNLTLHEEQQAEHYLKILAAAKAYRDAAKAYEDLLAQCECTEDSLVYAQTRYYDSGKQYLDDYDHVRRETIPVKEYYCGCCGRQWSFAEFDGKEPTWRHSGKVHVKTGLF
ncbi:hypothetical protein [Vibrio phage JSF12]|uniref:Uncharacterized protein n=2 Tax=Jesfedecavirus TaxID=2560156 RepID=A0A2D0Z6F3_9CAUD|nr:hypothetical protein FDI98_gp037 [Vibrio phage JSF10]YP_009794768.1 hypothetical protein HOS35_gp085 [Vibrio phage JSF12]ASV43495.1 hypothetical protein [Vibrio phage JSF10]ASV43603.1 hypothetical protein [Vibrio phage JSF12]